MQVNITNEELNEILSGRPGQNVASNILLEYDAMTLLCTPRIEVTVYSQEGDVIVPAIMLSGRWAMTPMLEYCPEEIKVHPRLRTITFVKSGRRLPVVSTPKRLLKWWLGLPTKVKHELENRSEKEIQFIDGLEECMKEYRV